MRLSLGTAEDTALMLARLAEVDAWYDQVYAAAKRADAAATMVKHDTLATLVVGGHSVLLQGAMYYGAQQTGQTPDQFIAGYLSPNYIDWAALLGDYNPPSAVQTRMSYDVAPTILNPSTGIGPAGGSTPTQPATASTVQTSILQTAADAAGLDASQAGWLEQNKWLVLGGAAVAAWFLFGRGK